MTCTVYAMEQFIVGRLKWHNCSSCGWIVTQNAKIFSECEIGIWGRFNCASYELGF